MDNDAVDRLIKRIVDLLPADQNNAQQNFADFLSQSDNLLSNVANYAQVVSTAGPIAAAAVDPLIESTAAATTTATAEAGALSLSLTVDAGAAASGAVTAGVGAAIVLFLSFLLGSIASSSSPDSSLAKALQQIQTEVSDINITSLAYYWNDQLNSGFHSYWNPPSGGGLQTDFDDLAAQGTGGDYVKKDASNYHDNANGFVDNLVPSAPAGANNLIPPENWGRFWQRPDLQELRFSPYSKIWYATLYPYGGEGLTNIPPNAPQNSPGFTQMWYGKLPQAQSVANPTGLPMVADPRTFRPYLSLAIQSYLTLQSLVNFIDKKQPTFSTFLSQYNRDLIGYADFLYSLYTQSVHGIVKSDLPSNADTLGYLTFYIFQRGHDAGKLGAASDAVQPIINDSKIGPASMPQFSVNPDYTTLPTAGTQWNGVYGVVDEYPPYGAYQPQPSSWGNLSPPGMAAPSYIIDMINTDGIDLVLTTDPYPYLLEFTFGYWLFPWLQAKLTLGRMARWKAIYIFNGNDKVWSFLQNLRKTITSVPEGAKAPSYQEVKLRDGTIATGDWSTRELCRVLNQIGGGLIGPAPSFTDPSGKGLSLFLLDQCLDNIGKGTWAGSAYASADRPRDESGKPLPAGLSRPASFRDLLAAAAV
ncbi:MAG: hypothetical protein OK455_06920 [Thaumarchaeota archaeon]|nr:hypothetical protein [Nitrososphaerota archaeon]